MTAQINHPIKVVKDHTFRSHYFKLPTLCIHCSRIILGLGKQGYKCQSCKYVVHACCVDNVSCNCRARASPESIDTISNYQNGCLTLNLLSLSTGTRKSVQIDIKQAQNLVGLKKNGLSDPFCKFVLMSGSQVLQSYKSEIQENTLNPVFQDTFVFTIPQDSDIALRVSLQSKSERKSKNTLGGFSLTLDHIMQYSTASDIQFVLFKGKLAHKHHALVVPTPSTVLEQVCEENNRVLCLDDFSVLSIVGEGGFGRVVLAELKESPEKAFAIKVISKEQIVSLDLMDTLLLEHRIALLPNKPSFLAGMLASFQDSQYLYMVFDFYAGGDLLYHIDQERIFPEHRTRFYIAEISIALFFLHSCGIAYRDLKLENVLLDNQGHIKLVDFGLCAEGIINGKTQTDTSCGTLEYMAPEVLGKLPNDCGADLWSLGILAYEMITGSFPFNAETEVELLSKIQATPTLRLPFYLSESAKLFIFSLLKENPTERLGYDNETGREEFRSASFFSQIDWVRLENREVKPPFVPRLTDVKSTAYFEKRSDTFHVSKHLSENTSDSIKQFRYTSTEILTLL